MRRKNDQRSTLWKKAAFVTKNTIIDETHSFPLEVDSMRLAPGAQTALPLLHAAGYRIVVLSNEPGVAHGGYTERALSRVEGRVEELIASAGALLAAFLYCPHHPSGSETLYAFECDCRMPQPGMLLQATAELHLNPGTSWMVGDVLDEVEAGHLARCRAVLVDDGNELEWRTDELRRPDGIADDLAEAALIIASSTRGGIRT